MGPVDTLRNALFGLPPSPATEPSREGVLAAFSDLNQRVTGAVAGIKPYATKAALDADTSQPAGTFGYVYADPTPANNKLYHYAPGGWVVDTVLGSAFFSTTTTITGDKNLFDLAAVQSGFEVQYSGAIIAEASSVASAPMYVGNLTTVSVSGLAPNPDFHRVYAFYSALPADETTFLSYGEFTGDELLGIPVPTGARFMRISPKQRQGGSVPLTAVQVEGGVEATVYQSYTPRILTVDGSRMGERPETPFIRSAAYGGALNLFDEDAAISGSEVRDNGGIYAEANSIASAPMYVGDLDQITFSGLAPNPAIDRVYAFYSALPAGLTEFVSAGHIPASGAAKYTVSVPSGAKWMRFSPKQRQSGSVPIDQVQAEPGSVASPFQAYREQLVMLNDHGLGRDARTQTGSSIGTMAIFGDSISQTGDVDNGDYVYGSHFRPNWPDYAIPLLAPSTAYNFARAEASFATRPSTLTLQSFAGQITTAFGVSGLDPDVVVVALGINDLRFLGIGSLGDYATTMGKPYGSLDPAIPADAIRQGFHRLQGQWPDSIKFASLPLQAIDAAQLQFVNIRALGDLIMKFAIAYGFTVIDAFAESGIVAEFEVNGGDGQDLEDGLHPKSSGQRKQGRLIAARIRARY